MKTKFVFLNAIIIMLLVMASKGVEAGVDLSETLSFTGFMRYELGVHAAGKNPNLPENHDLTLSKFFLQTEWTYEPSDVFKVFSNIRFLADTTYHWDSNLDTYNAFPMDVQSSEWTMMKTSGDDYRAEVWELYADISLGDLWLRLGRQQIVWGETIGARFLDAINPLDLSWNFMFEPEEFEIIRIPTWAARGIFNLSEYLPGWITSPSIEAFLNPGDVLPNQYADRGAPFFLTDLPPILIITEKDNRGDIEYGIRVGAMIHGFYGTLNYMHLHSDDFNLDFKEFGQGGMLLDAKYEEIDLYGASLNYAFAHPYNLVISFEGVWIPNQPYGDATSVMPEIRDQGTGKYAISFSRNTWLWPKKSLSSSMAMITLQFSQTVVEGDEDNILGAGNAKVDKSVENLTLQIQQPLLHNNLTLGFQTVYDTDSAYFIKPSVKYTHGDYWYFDVYATFLGGSEDRPGRFGSFSWADTVYGRITFQF